MLLGTAHKLKNRNSLHLTINDDVLSSVNCHKLLGIHVDHKLTWGTHFDTQCKLIESRIARLQRLNIYLPVHARKVFSSYILPLLDFCSTVWGSSSQINSEKLIKLQKRAARIILYKDVMDTLCRNVQIIKLDTI